LRVCQNKPIKENEHCLDLISLELMRDKKALINALKKLMNLQKKLKNQRLLEKNSF
jgi:hypothetical protein